jgi:hypothetical protein
MTPTARRGLTIGSMAMLVAILILHLGAGHPTASANDGAQSIAVPVAASPARSLSAARLDDVSASPASGWTAPHWSDARAVVTALFLTAAFGVILSLLVWDLDAPTPSRRSQSRPTPDVRRAA